VGVRYQRGLELKQILIILITFAITSTSADETIEIADRIDWADYPAHFVDTNEYDRKLIHASMLKQAKCSSKNSSKWFCTEDYVRIFEGINGSGKKLELWYVCSEKHNIPVQTYYPERLLEIVKCIEFTWDYEAKDFSLE